MTLISDHHSTISVGPHNANGEVAQHTSFSYAFDVFAPGGSRVPILKPLDFKDQFPVDIRVHGPNADFDDVLCAIGQRDYGFLTLGSAAMPHVAGAVALIKSFLPDADVETIRQILRASSLPLTPAGNLLEARGGRLSLRLVRNEIDKRLK